MDTASVEWYDTPPGRPVEVDPSSPDVEVLPVARIDGHGQPRARAVKVTANRWATLGSPAWVVAWARPSGGDVWRWVLLLWLDKPKDPPGPQAWRAEWVEPDMTLIKQIDGGQAGLKLGTEAAFAETLRELLDGLG